MKVYSVLIVSITLFVFYNLAVHQENLNEQKDSKEQRKVSMELTSKGNIYQAEFSSCSINKESDLVTTFIESHHVGQDDFAMQVSGKDHKYLYTGVTFIPSVKLVQTEAHFSAEISQVEKSSKKLNVDPTDSNKRLSQLTYSDIERSGGLFPKRIIYPQDERQIYSNAPAAGSNTDAAWYNIN